MKLSYCMIVKNEAETLEKNLKNARPHVDEMVIVDTGSDDGTKEIAKEYADVFDEIEWPGSFSKARNYSLGLASGDYIMYLDGDEAITDEEYWVNIRGILEQERPDGVAIQIENDLPGNQILEGDRIWEVRIFRNHPDIEFRGRVHNQITPAINENPMEGRDEPMFLKVEAVSHHIGYSYSKEELKEKYRKRIPLLEAEIEEADTEKWEQYYRYQLVNGLFMLEEYDEAYRALQECDDSRLTEENKFSLYLMAVHLAVDRDPDEGNEYALKMIDLWPQEPISYMMKGIVELRRGRDNGALTLLLAAIQTMQSRDNVRYDVDIHYAASAAGEAAFKMELYEKAKRLFQFHLEKYPGNEKVRQVEQAIKRRDEAENPPSEQGVQGTPIQPEIRRG